MSSCTNNIDFFIDYKENGKEKCERSLFCSCVLALKSFLISLSPHSLKLWMILFSFKLLLWEIYQTFKRFITRNIYPKQLDMNYILQKGCNSVSCSSKWIIARVKNVEYFSVYYIESIKLWKIWSFLNLTVFKELKKRMKIFSENHQFPNHFQCEHLLSWNGLNAS